MAASDQPEATGPIEGHWERHPVSGDGEDYVQTYVSVDRPCRPYVAAPGQRARCPENRGGDFYTDCENCLICDVPHQAAPDLMAYVAHPEPSGTTHCVFTKQPTTPDEIERAIDAMCNSEVCGIRYGGTDPNVLRRIAARRSWGEGTADAPLRSGVRDSARWAALALVGLGLCMLGLALGWQASFPWSLQMPVMRSATDVGWGGTVAFALLAAIAMGCAVRTWRGRMDAQAAFVTCGWLALLAVGAYFAFPWMHVMGRIGV